MTKHVTKRSLRGGSSGSAIVRLWPGLSHVAYRPPALLDGVITGVCPRPTSRPSVFDLCLPGWKQGITTPRPATTPGQRAPAPGGLGYLKF